MRSLVALLKVTAAVLAVNAIVAGCYAVDSARGDRSEQSEQVGTAAGPTDGVGVDQAVEAYTSAVNEADLDGIVGAFEPTGTIVDVGREIRGAEAIRHWADTEVVGGRIEVLERHPRAGGIDLLVRFSPPPGTSDGFRAWYRFDIQDARIRLATLSYA